MAWALLLNSTNVIGSRYWIAVCSSMPCMKKAPSPATTTGPPTSSPRTPCRSRRRSCSPCRPCRAPRRSARRAGRAGDGLPRHRCCPRRRRCPRRRAPPRPAPSWRRGSGCPAPWWAGGRSSARGTVGHAQARRPATAAQARVQLRQRRAQVIGVDVGAGQVRRRRPDRDRPHRGQRVVEAGPAVTVSRVPTNRHTALLRTASADSGMAHHPGHAER